LENNTYIDNLLITCNDPDETSRELPISVTLDVVISGFSATGTVPQTYTMAQNYPNPFNPTTSIAYGLPQSPDVMLAVYDVAGRLVRTLEAGVKSAGNHQVIWDAKDNSGGPVSTGIYVYRLIARGKDGETFSRSMKLILMK
jgi:flagellar hook assembly protein FlgD